MPAEVTRLLKRGLNHYGLGDLESAIASWEQVLAHDPENRAALDYLESARAELAQCPRSQTRKRLPPPSVDPEDRTPRTLGALLQDAAAASSGDDPVARALEHYKAGKLDVAYAQLEEVARLEPERLDVEGYLAMIRGKRARCWARDVGDQGRALRVVMPLEKLKELDLRPDEGYLLSQIDGVTSIEQLLSMARDRLRALEILSRLLSEGIVE